MSQKALSILLLFNLVFGIPSFAEEEQAPNPVYKRGSTILEQTLPPSPESASRVKYADVPFTHTEPAGEGSRAKILEYEKNRADEVRER